MPTALPRPQTVSMSSWCGVPARRPWARRLVSAAAGAGLAASLATPAAAAPPAGAVPATTRGALPGAAQPACYDTTVAGTLEEQRLDQAAVGGTEPASTVFIRAGGFTPLVERFLTELCATETKAGSLALVQRTGTRLWRTAVDRAQGRVRRGILDRYDDRPLYWSRLTMTRAVRRWAEAQQLPTADRDQVLKRLEYTSRGVDSVELPPGDTTTRVLVSGFDPYQLRGEVRRSNPSGVSALQLDGRRIRTETGPAVVQAVMLPVLWGAFERGIVEDAFGPSLVPSARKADLIMTISQAGRGRMAIEEWAGAWRGGSPDNEEAREREEIPQVARWPQPARNPQWIRTTLPWQQMVRAGTSPWPVVLNSRVCEWPAGADFPEPAAVVCRADGPSPGSRAQAGGGGNYLSNESMYRSNRLRRALRAHDVPGGHLHISAIVYPADPADLTDAVFEADRRAVADQTVALVDAAATAQSARDAAARARRAAAAAR